MMLVDLSTREGYIDDVHACVLGLAAVSEPGSAGEGFKRLGSLEYAGQLRYAFKMLLDLQFTRIPPRHIHGYE